MKTIPTKTRLAAVLEEHGLPDLAKRARRGRYDDYESESATPTVDLVRILLERGHPDLAQRAKDGEWDGTKEEGDAWLRRSPEVLAGLGVTTPEEAMKAIDQIHRDAGSPDLAAAARLVKDPFPIPKTPKH